METKQTILSVVIGLVLATALYPIAHSVGYQTAKKECAEQRADKAETDMSNFITSFKELTANAHFASNELALQITANRETSTKTVQEIRNALKTTEHLRIDCVFDANSLQQLDSAQQRATKATTGGISRTLSTASSSGK